MRLQPVDSLSLTRPSMVEYFLFAIRVVHGLTAILPGLLLLFYLREQHPETTKSYFAVLIFFGVVSVLFFQALGVYAENIFSNRWRLQLTLFAWSAAFCLLLFMHRALDLFNYISNAELLVWYLGSLLLFGVERMILLTLFKRLMSRGIFLQQAVILGATENGVRLAEYLAQHQDIRSGVIGFIDDRMARLPDTVAHLPVLGNTQDLEKMIREERVALILLSPVMLLVALAIKLDSPGPVLFRQKRYGYNNRLIEVFKFRSMYQNQSDFTADKQTTRGDPRVTRVGRFIRKTSLDELPQLFNVFAGSMSMVGPRPHATATKAAGILFEEAVQEYTARHRVKPGITGWAQINGYRGETDTLEKIEKRVEFDLEYIENWSVWFDLYILFRTVPAVILTKEAF